MTPPQVDGLLWNMQEQVRFAWWLFSGKRAAHERWLAELRRRDVAEALGVSELPAGWRVLDLANGRLRPQYDLLRAAGHRVVGIDLVNRPSMALTDRLYATARTVYARQAGANGNMSRTLVCGNVERLSFSNASFDLVTSVAAFEHFADVPRVLDEVRRVLRPGGVVWACIHLFTSLSGGHNVGSTEIPLRRLPRGVEPWDHLRRQRLPLTVPLNRWRRDEYRAAFAARFTIVKDYCAVREGQTFLTSEVQAELSAYTPEELTCGAYVLVARA